MSESGLSAMIAVRRAYAHALRATVRRGTEMRVYL